MRGEGAARPGLTVLAAFLRRDWFIDLSYRATFALQMVSTLFTLALFFYLGRVIDDAAFSADQGLESGYFEFVAIGLSLFVIVQTSMVSFSRKLREEQTTGTFEALMATPASPALIILASAAYEILRAAVDGLVLFAAAVVVFGLALDTSPEGVLIALSALVGSLGLFASLGVTIAALTVLFKRTAAIINIAMTAVALLSGVYFPVEVLPAPLAAAADVIPFTWALDVLRSALLGGEIESIRLAGLVASVLVLLPLALFGFRLSVARARRTGTLAEY